MRIANLSARLVLVEGDRALDVASASSGRFDANPAAVFDRWDEFAQWASTADRRAAEPFDPAKLGPPSPRPRQIIGVGLNYADHAAEAGMAIPDEPLVFTKFPSSVTGPDADVRLAGPTVDWEAELVVVIGRGGRRIPVAEASGRIAGYTVGQDLSERTVQWHGDSPQFSMGKSFEGFAPIGPVIASLDEFADPDRLGITTTIVSTDGTETVVQRSSTDQLIFGVAELLSRLSEVIELLPGDLIFTGTPPGVGAGMNPKRFLVAGETLRTEIEGIGTIVQRFVGGDA